MFAEIGDAFAESEEMTVFEHAMRKADPYLMKKVLIERPIEHNLIEKPVEHHIKNSNKTNSNLNPDYSPNINSNANIMISPRSEEHINSQSNSQHNQHYNKHKHWSHRLSPAFYDRTIDAEREFGPQTEWQYLYPGASYKQGGVIFPLTRHQHYNGRTLGTTLLEGFNGDNSDTWCFSGMSFWKLLLLIVLIVLLVYGGYKLMKKKSGNASAMSVGSVGTVGTASADMFF